MEINTEMLASGVNQIASVTATEHKINTNKEASKIMALNSTEAESIESRFKEAKKVNATSITENAAKNIATNKRAMSAAKVGMYGLGALATIGLAAKLFGSRGEQSNAQLYGQQPLY